jgi:hypothetical protein
MLPEGRAFDRLKNRGRFAYGEFRAILFDTMPQRRTPAEQKKRKIWVRREKEDEKWV